MKIKLGSKKIFVGLSFIFALAIVSVAVFAADKGPLAPIGKLISSIFTGIASPALEAASKTVTSMSYTLLFFLMILFVVQNASMPIVGNKKGFAWVLAIIIAAIATKFLGTGLITVLSSTYAAVGAAIFVVVPFAILFYVSASLPEFLYKTVWIVAGIIFFALSFGGIFQGENIATDATAGVLSNTWVPEVVYFLGAMAAIYMLFKFDAVRERSRESLIKRIDVSKKTLDDLISQRATTRQITVARQHITDLEAQLAAL